MATTCLLAVLLVILHTNLAEHELIPTNFPLQNLSNYTIRYLSMSGNDTEKCLENQPFPYKETDSEPCGSLRYALTDKHYDLMSYNQTNLIVLILPGRYGYGNVSIWMNYYENIVVRKLPDAEGEVVFHCSEYLNYSYNNLYFVNSSYLYFRELVFTECGPWSHAMSSMVAEHMVIEDCVYRDNLGNGLVVYQGKDVLIFNTIFQDNNNIRAYNDTRNLEARDLGFAGGLSLIFRNSTNRTVTVRNCTFLRNHANLSEENKNESQARPSTHIPRGHGGAMVISLNRAEDHVIMVEDTTFYDNTAVHNAGGMYIALSQQSKGNRIVVRNSCFRNNSCFLAGGGISVHVFQIANENLLRVENTTFEDNSAWLGGGACTVNLRDNLIPNDTDLILKNVAVFSDCIFVNNSSPTGGSAVGLVSNARVDQALATTNFTNCSFTSNSADNQSAIFAFRFPITLQGTVTFTGNKGGGVSLLQTRMDVQGDISFEDNMAPEGAGIAMRDQSLLHLFNGTTITFINNTAVSVGGAISVRNPSVGLDVIPLFNTRCFIQYEVNTASISLDPAQWNVKLQFFNNTAGENGAAIYATDISRCTYTPSLNDTTNEYEKSIFSVSPQPFQYSGNRVLNATVKRLVERVSTAPSKLNITPLELVSAPGEVLEFSVSAVDQSGNWEQAIWSLDDTDTESLETGEEEFFVLPAGGTTHPYTMKGVTTDQNSKCESGVPQTLNFSLVQLIAGDIANTSEVRLNVTCCHPGYLFSEKDGTCVYNRNYNPVIVRPDTKNRYVYIEPEIYAEVRESGELVAAVMPPIFQNCTQEGSLTGCLFKFDSPSEQCAQNRAGFLCGRCPEGQGVDLTLNQCRECTVGDAVILTVIVIFLVVCSVLALIFNIGIPNDLKGCLFFAQVVGFVYHNTRTDSILWDFHLSRVFGFSFYLPLCPAPGYNALATASYGFLLPILAIATVVVYIISARFIRPLSQRASFDGIWLLGLLTYKYTADTCFSILRCQKVSGASGEFVYYYDGSIKCFDVTRHLGPAIFALLLGLVVVVFFPILILVISFKHFKVSKSIPIQHTQPFTDVLNKGLKSSCRWWSGFDLLRRLLFIIVVFFFSSVSPSYTQLALLFSGLTVFFIFACSQPYKKRRTNIIEAFILLDLLLLTALFLNLNERSQTSTLAFAKTLLLLPFISVAIYIIVRIISLVWKGNFPMSFKRFMQQKMPKMKRQMFGAISHNLELTEYNTEGSDVPEVEDNSTELQTVYSAYREELLAEDEDGEQT